MPKGGEGAGVNASAIDVAGVFCGRLMQTLEDARKHLSDNSAAGALARGKVISLAADYDHAIVCFEEAIALDKNLTEASARLALTQLKAGQPEAALRSAMKLAAQQPKFMIQELMSNERISAMTILGEALLANGRINDAVAAYKSAREISDKDSYAAGRLAQVLVATGNASEAIKLAGQFSANPRSCFRDLNAIMPLGQRNAALLPAITAESLVANIARCVPGRPILSDGAPRLAPLVWGDDRWCMDLPEKPAQ